MRLRSLLAMTDLGLELVTGEEELDRFVRWVVTQDLPDPSRYLSGGELVLTGMQWRGGPQDSERFVAALARSKAAALATGDARYGAPPEDVVQACRKYRIPLFRVDERVAFATVTERITRILSTGRAADLTAILDRHRQLVAGTGLGSVLELIERDLDMRCWVMSTTGRVVAGPAAPPPARTVTEFLSARRLPHVVHTEPRPYSLFAVDEFGTSRVADWLLVFDSDCSDWLEQRRALAGELGAIVSLERVRNDDRQRAEGRLAEELVQLIVSDAKPAEIISRLELTGLGVSDSYVAVAAAAEDILRPRELRALLREILYGRTPATGLVDGEAIALIPADDTALTEIDAALRTLEPGLGGVRLSVGVSGIVDGEGLRGAVEEARYARRMAAGRGRATALVGHDELATHMMLLASVPDEVRRMFRLRLLDPLTTYDQDNGADLGHTLQVFLQTNGSWARSAELLHLHVNTLRYRIARIEELTGRDLSRLEDRVDFFLALALG